MLFPMLMHSVRISPGCHRINPNTGFSSMTNASSAGQQLEDDCQRSEHNKSVVLCAVAGKDPFQQPSAQKNREICQRRRNLITNSSAALLSERFSHDCKDAALTAELANMQNILQIDIVCTLGSFSRAATPNA